MSNPEIGLYWGHFLETTYRSPRPVLKYIKNTMILEDVRNPELALRAETESNWRKLLTDLCTVRKRWERHIHHDVYQQKLLAYETARNHGQIPLEISEEKFSSYQEAIKTYMALRWINPKELRQDGKMLFAESLLKWTKNPITKELLEKCKVTSWLILLAVECSFDIWEEGLNTHDSKVIVP